MLSKSILDKQQKIRELHIFNQEKNKNILNNYYRTFKKNPKIRQLSNDILERKDFQTNLRAKNYTIYGKNEKINSINTNYNLFNPYVTMLLASGIKLSNYDSNKYVIKKDNDKNKKYYFGLEGKTPLYDDDDEIFRNTNWNTRDNKGKKRIFSSLIGNTYCDLNSSKNDGTDNNNEDNDDKYDLNEYFQNEKLKNKKKENEIENKKLDEYYEKYHVQLNMSPDEFKKFKEFSVKTLTGDSNIKNEMKSIYRTNPDLFKCSIDEEIMANDAYLDEFRNKKKKKIDDEEKETFYKKYGINDELTEEEVLRIFDFLKEQTKSNNKNKISVSDKDNGKNNNITNKNKPKLLGNNNTSILNKMISEDPNPIIFHEGENDFHDPYESLRKMKLNYQLANTLTYIRKNLQFNQFNDFYTKVIEPRILSSKMKNVKITLKKKRKNMEDFKAKLFELFRTRARHKNTNMSFNEFKNIDFDYRDPQPNINKLINARIQEKIKNDNNANNLLDLINTSPYPVPKLSRAQVLLHLRIELITLSFPKHPPSRTMSALSVDSEEGVVYVYGGRGGIRFGDIFELRLGEGNTAVWNRIFMNKKDKLVTDESEPKERFGSTMHFYNDRLYIIGGEFEDWEMNSPSNTVLIIFNIKTRKWDMVTNNELLIKEPKLPSIKNIEKNEENNNKNNEKEGEEVNTDKKEENHNERNMEKEEIIVERRKFVKSDDSLFPCCSNKNIWNKGNKIGNSLEKKKYLFESEFKGGLKLTKYSKFRSTHCSTKVLNKGKNLYKSSSIKLKPVKNSKILEKKFEKKITSKIENVNKSKEILEENSKTNNNTNGENNNNNNDGLPTEKQENLYWNLKPCLRRNHVSILIGRSLFLYGGLDPSQHYLNDCWVFDLVSQFWSPVRVTGRAPPPLGHHCGCLVLDSENCNSEELSLYNIPVGNRKNVKTLKTEGVFFFGGMNENRTPTNLFFYMRIGSKPVYFDIPKTEGKPPSPRISASMDFSPLINMIIIHGGRNDKKNEEFLNDFMLLDLETMNWIEPRFKDSIPAPRAEHQSAILGDKLLIFGGSNRRQVFNFDFTLVNLNFYQIAENKIRAEEDFFEDTFNDEK